MYGLWIESGGQTLEKLPASGEQGCGDGVPSCVRPAADNVKRRC